MALSAQDFKRLTDALGYRVTLAQEFANALFTPAPLSLALKRNIAIAMADNATANEVINALQTGNAVLSAKAQKRFLNMMANTNAAATILSLLSLSSQGILQLLTPVLTFSSYASQVNNTGTTTLLGTVGVSPGGTVTGSPTISGGTQAGTPAAAAALASIQATYTALAAKVATTSLTGQNLGGLTLTPGVYNYASTAQLTGTLTLNANGNPNAVFVIQVGSTLTTAAGSSVVLTGGATADNVYWQVGSSATLGADTAFAGNILAATGITMGAGASNNGRLLAETGTLTLNTNVVSPLPVNPSALPAVPTSLVVTPGNTFVTPIWNPSVGATSYNLYFNTTGAPTTASTKIAGAVSGVNITGLTNSTTYHYVVTAVGPGGESTISTAANATPTAVTVATPTFSPVAGAYGPTQSVTISSSTAGSTFYYTTDGSTPTVFSTLYSGPVSVAVSETLKAMATHAGNANSAVGSAVYTINGTVATPTFSPVAGTYTGLQTVTVSSLTAGATFYYTTNGSTPTTGSTLYSGPVSVGSSETLKVLATKTNFTNSAVGSAAYVISAAGPATVNLASAGTYRILAQSGITNASSATVGGDMGVSPIGYAAITGFSLTPATPSGGNTSATSALVTGGGLVYASDYTAPTPSNLSTAVGAQNAAYTDAQGRATPDHIDFGSGNLGGLTLTPGLYKWTTAVTIPTDVTFNGGASDTWILQIPSTLGLATSTSVLLTGGALPQNIFWAVAGAVSLGTSSVFNGIVLGATSIACGATSTQHGRLYAGTAVTLISGSVVA